MIDNSTKQQIGTCILVINQENELLLGIRKNGYLPGKYGLPGGRIEVNEPLFDSANRELLEETNIKTDNLEYLGIIRENQGEIDFIHFVFLGRVTNQLPKLCEPNKCEGWEWHNLDNIDKIENKILNGHNHAIKLYKNSKAIIDITDNNS